MEATTTMKIEDTTTMKMEATPTTDTTSTRISIENLPLTVNEKWLEQRLLTFGVVEGMIFRYPPPPKRPFAFIEFENASAAAKAIHSLNTSGYDGVKVVARASRSLNGYDRITITPYRVALEALPSLMTQQQVWGWLVYEGKSDATHVEVDGCGNGIAYFITHTAMKDAIRALDRTVLDGHRVRVFPEAAHITQSILTTCIATSGLQIPSPRATHASHVPTASAPKAPKASTQRPIKQEPREFGRSRSVSRSRSPCRRSPSPSRKPHHRGRPRYRQERSHSFSGSRSRSRSASYSRRYRRRARSRSRSRSQSR